ncbi:MAG: hypothetical protein KDD46_01335 [Bdellovibrionales bacterium]|nr:hypothetical protein [Bdellovibrionales bacterium]
MRVILQYMFCLGLILASVSVEAKDSVEGLLANLKVSLEQNQKVMKNIVQKDDNSECLKFKNCKTNVTESDTIDTYFQDDIDLALEGLSL